MAYSQVLEPEVCPDFPPSIGPSIVRMQKTVAFLLQATTHAYIHGDIVKALQLDATIETVAQVERAGGSTLEERRDPFAGQKLSLHLEQHIRLALLNFQKNHSDCRSRGTVSGMDDGTNDAGHSGSLAATALHAIRALYGMEGAERQREANAFLVTFADSEAAWGVGVELLVDATRDLPPEVLFFAANMLHAKARRGWAKLPVESRAATAAAVLSALVDLQTGRRAFHAALFSKLCAVYAVALAAAPDECSALLERLVATTPGALASGDCGQVLFFLTFARCVCEELEDAELPFAAKDAMEMHVYELSKDVTRAVAAVVTARVDAPPAAAVDLRSEAFGCLDVWIKKAGVSLTAMFLHDRALLFALVDALCSKSKYLPVCAEILCKAITVSEYPAPGEQEAALGAVANGLLRTRAACESALVAEEDEISHAITHVVSTFCETYVDWIVDGRAPEAVALGEMMLFLGAHPRRQIASLTLEFWLLVQDEPVAARHAYFQREGFRQLFDVLLRQCRFAQEASEMDELELDDLLAFRSGSQGVADAFLAVFSLQSEQMLVHLAALLSSASASVDEWPSVEACLFALSTIADDLKQRLSTEASSRDGGGPLEALVTQIFACVLGASSPHPLVATSATKLLGQFGAWFNKKARGVRGGSGAFEAVAAVLRYLDSALGVAQSRSTAARSFMQVATTCAECLAHMPSDLLVSSIRHFASGEMAIGDRLAVVEGLVRAAAVSAHCTVVLDAVLSDALSRLDQVLALGLGGGNSGGIGGEEQLVASVVCNELQVLSKVVRFLDAPSEAAGGRAVTSSVVQHVWPHLEPVVPRLRAHEPVMDALFQLYGWCLQSLREEMASQLDVIADAIVHVFDAHQFVAPLECAAVAVDVFGKRGGSDSGDASLSPAVVSSFRELLGLLSCTAFRFFTTHALGDAPDVLRAFYELAYRFVLFCPAAVLLSSDLPVLIELGLACVGNQDRASTNAVLVFLTFLLAESRGKLAPFQAQVGAAVLPHVAEWVDALVAALAAKSPSILFDALGRLLFALLSNFADADAVHEALLQALTTKSAVLGLAELSPADRERVLRLWLRLARAPTRQAERRFRGLCADVAKICRRELTADALETYE
ncbi:hypothetical protein PybrP1_010647 [[Pythium] brassicae (nom. inval.)]|nr:hypothetical protein PybrP1_010647 [[Pythium] brassicae (nom. inval.)]